MYRSSSKENLIPSNSKPASNPLHQNKKFETNKDQSIEQLKEKIKYF
jgi:hypothetical protein